MITLRTLSAVLILSLLPVFSSVLAYTTPGTGVLWSGDDLVEHSAGAVTWNEEEERYEIGEELEIAASDTVLLQQDVYSFHDDSPDFRVSGVLFIWPLDSLGQDSLLLTGDEADGPGGIRVEDGGSLSLFRVIYEGGGYIGGFNGRTAVKVVDGNVLLEGCRFGNWDRYVIEFSGGQGLIEDCLFHDNFQWTININLSAEVTIRSCTLVRNNLEASGPKNPINTGTQGFNTVLVEDCLVEGSEGNPHGGIAVWNLLGNGADVTVRNTTVENCAFGMIAQGEDVEVLVTDCSFLNNNTNPDPMVSGSGITVQVDAIVTAARNTITGNHWGITTLTGGQAMLGNVDSPNPDEQGHNRIYDNGNNGQVYNYYNNTNLPQLAQNNWWGSDDPEVVEDGIFHQPDDPSLGPVTYLPLWNPNANEPPEIISFEPQDTLLFVHYGDAIHFAITAQDPENDSLAYSFLLDGELTATEPETDLTFITEGQFLITGIATDTQQQSDSIHWQVTMVNTAPVITSYEPEDLTGNASPGDIIHFALSAEDDESDTLSYRFTFITDQGETTVEEQMVDYTVGESGLLTVTGSVRDPLGESDSVTWSFDIAGAGESGNGLPSTFALDLFPNPFNREIRIAVSLPEQTALTLEIFDLTGRRVAIPAQGIYTAGIYRTSWRADTFSSGTYFIAVSTGSWTALRRIVLLK